ncbi:MAG TPA: hypothetical protein VGL24_08075 [Chthoniobacterales bacterium]|jgi:hypothetical protein
MEAETKDNRGEGTEENVPEQNETRPLSKLRDLRPEKDPIGAGRGGFLKPETKRL